MIFVRDNPRLSIPVIIALLAMLSFVIFDPMRIFFVTNEITQRFKVSDWLSFFQISEWLSSLMTYTSSIFYGKELSRVKRGLSTDLLKDWDELQQRLISFLKETPGENRYFV